MVIKTIKTTFNLSMEGTIKNKNSRKSKVSESDYKELIDNLDVGFFQVTLDGKLIHNNRAYYTILGYSSSNDLSNKDVREFWKVLAVGCFPP